MSIQTTLVTLILAVAIAVVSAFSPVDHHLIDCGTTDSTTTVDLDHRKFTGDGSSTFLSTTQSVALKNSNPNPNFSPIYHTARVFTKASSYRFRVKEKGTHLVRLHFQRFNFESIFGACHVKFHVSANSYVLLHDFTTPQKNPRIMDFLFWVDDDELVIKFTPAEKSSFAFVNAIEVISAPKDLIADVAQFVGSDVNGRVNGIMKFAYETMHRINVGGVTVTPFNDSLWRNWVPDDEFLELGDRLMKSYQKTHFGGRIQYQLGGASREVGPDNVYNSARVISSLNDSIPNLNLTWVLPVTEGFKYLVRLHFCDIASVSLGMIYFNVYLNGNLAYENLDLSTLTNFVLASPFYADFVVDADKSSSVIRVDVGPSNLSRPHAVDGILNGLEIWKMNNSRGSLDGEFLVCELGAKDWHNGEVSRLLSLTGAVCLLVIAFLVMRRRAEVKEYVGWSRVPVDVSEINLKSNYPKSTIVNV